MAHEWIKTPARVKTLNRYVRDDGKVIVEGRSKDYRVYDVVNGVTRVRTHSYCDDPQWWHTAAEAKAAADQ